MEDIRKGWHDIKSEYNQEEIISFINEQDMEKIYKDSAQKTAEGINTILENKGTTMLRGLPYNVRNPKEPNTNILKMLLGESKRSFEDIEKIYKKNFRSKSHLEVNVIIFLSLRPIEHTPENLAKIVIGNRHFEIYKIDVNLLIKLFKSLDYGFHSPTNAKEIIGDLKKLSFDQKIEVFKSYDWIYKSLENAEELFDDLYKSKPYTFEQKLEIFGSLYKNYRVPRLAKEIFGDLQEYDQEYDFEHFERRIKLFENMQDVCQYNPVYEAQNGKGLLCGLKDATDMQKITVIKSLKVLYLGYDKLIKLFELDNKRLDFQQKLTMFSHLTRSERSMELAKVVFEDLDKLIFEQKLAVFAEFDVKYKNLNVCVQLFGDLKLYNVNERIKILELVDWYYELCSTGKEELIGTEDALIHIEKTISEITDKSADLSNEAKLQACVRCCKDSPSLVEKLWCYCYVEDVVGGNTFGREQVINLYKKLIDGNGNEFANKFMAVYLRSHKFLTDTEKIDFMICSRCDFFSCPGYMKIDFSEIGSHAIAEIVQSVYCSDERKKGEFCYYVENQKENKENKAQYQEKISNDSNSTNVNSEKEKDQKENKKQKKKGCIIF